MIVVEIIAVVLLLGTIAFVAGDKMSKNAGSKAARLIEGLDEHYNDFIGKQQTLLVLENKDTAPTEGMFQHYADEVFIVLKPEIDALIGHINATTLSDVTLSYKSRFFQNVAALTESYFEKRKATQVVITERDEERLYSAVRDAIRADLKERLLNWKIGNL
jgi:hypothetical protein